MLSCKHGADSSPFAKPANSKENTSESVSQCVDIWRVGRKLVCVFCQWEGERPFFEGGRGHSSRWQGKNASTKHSQRSTTDMLSHNTMPNLDEIDEHDKKWIEDLDYAVTGPLEADNLGGFGRRMILGHTPFTQGR